MRHLHWIRNTVFALAILACAPVHAELTYEASETDDGVGFIIVFDRFHPDDDLSEFVGLVQRHQPEFVTFQSGGGNIYKAMELGRLIRVLGLDTFQIRSLECSSACTLAFIGGVGRYAEPGAIGVHRSSFSDVPDLSVKDAVSAIQATTADIIAYMQEMGVDPGVMKLALVTDTNDMRYLSGAEMDRYGIKTHFSKATERLASTPPSPAPTMPASTMPASTQPASTMPASTPPASTPPNSTTRTVPPPMPQKIPVTAPAAHPRPTPASRPPVTTAPPVTITKARPVVVPTEENLFSPQFTRRTSPGFKEKPKEYASTGPATTLGDIIIPVARTGWVRHPKGTVVMKASADAKARDLRIFRNGTWVEILGNADRWYRVKTGTHVGYMHHTWLKIDQYDATPGLNRLVQIKSFQNYGEAIAYVSDLPYDASIYLASNGWYAITLPDSYPRENAIRLTKSLKRKQQIPGDSFITLGNTYMKRICCL